SRLYEAVGDREGGLVTLLGPRDGRAQFPVVRLHAAGFACLAQELSSSVPVRSDSAPFGTVVLACVLHGQQRRAAGKCHSGAVTGPGGRSRPRGSGSSGGSVASEGSGDSGGLGGHAARGARRAQRLGAPRVASRQSRRREPSPV